MVRILIKDYVLNSNGVKFNFFSTTINARTICVLNSNGVKFNRHNYPSRSIFANVLNSNGVKFNINLATLSAKA